MAQLMPLPLTVSCSSKIQIGFTFLVPAYPVCPGKEAVKWLLLLYCGYLRESCWKLVTRLMMIMMSEIQEREALQQKQGEGRIAAATS